MHVWMCDRWIRLKHFHNNASRCRQGIKLWFVFFQLASQNQYICLKKIISVPYSGPLSDMLLIEPGTPGGQDKHKYFRLNPALKYAMIGMQAGKQVSEQARKSFGWTKIGEIIDVTLKYRCSWCPLNRYYCQKTNEQTFNPFPNPQGELAFGHMNNATIALCVAIIWSYSPPQSSCQKPEDEKAITVWCWDEAEFFPPLRWNDSNEASGVSQLLGRVAYTCWLFRESVVMFMI